LIGLNLELPLENPWRVLPEQPPYILPADREVLRSSGKDPAQLRLNLLPMPFLGDPRTASVVLLALNPGYHPRDDVDILDSTYRDLAKQSLLLGPSSLWCLDGRIRGTPAHRWWSTHLSRLIIDCGLQKVRQAIACVQWFPYHSATFRHLGRTLPSQEYGFRLVMQAVNRNGLIVILRSKRLWLQAVPQIDVAHFLQLRVPRSAFLSPANLPPGGYELVKNRVLAAGVD